jgi:pimeloyl-ACP methyl ester carboxylesterase
MQADEQNLTMTLGDGRKLGFAEYGDRYGRAVFYFHGSGSSRLEHPSNADILKQLNIHFISVDRPGNGLSDFQTDRVLIDWPKDIAQLAEHLEIDHFYVAGHSAGGPHALVCAHQLPEQVLAAAAISSVAPMDRDNAYRGMPMMNLLLARSARQFPVLVHLIRWFMRKMVMGDLEKATKQLMPSIPDTDKTVLNDPHNAEIFINAVREGFRSGWQGVAQDDILINRDWGFDLSMIRPHVDIWHGTEDVNVPIGAAEYLHERLPHAQANYLSGEGHFFLLKYWGKILSTLVES